MHHVNLSGSDSTGDGSQSRPWRTIKHAISQVQPGDHLRLGSGEFVETAEITKALTIEGTGSTTIIRVSPRARHAVRINGNFKVTLRNLAVHCQAQNWGVTIRTGIFATGADLTLERMSVHTARVYSVIIEKGNLNVKDVLITDAPAGTVNSDLGIKVDDSTAQIDGLTGGPTIDHIIDAHGKSRVDVKNSVFNGSSTSNANGVRLQHDSQGEIVNCRFLGQGATGTPPPFVPNSAIQVQDRSVATIRNNVISNFGNRILISGAARGLVIEGNQIVGSDFYGLVTGLLSSANPDLGGGSLGSKGGNVIAGSKLSDVFMFNGLDMQAKRNYWGTTDPAQIARQIHDKHDDPALGEVIFGPAWSPVTEHRSAGAFVAAVGAVDVINFDTDPSGRVIAAPLPGVLANAPDFRSVNVVFDRGVIVEDPGAQSGSNIISNTGIQPQQGPAVRGRLIDPVKGVGITNTAAEAVLRVFGEGGVLLGEINTDDVAEVPDFVGLVSAVPIHRFEYDFVGGIGFGGDDLIVARP